MPALVRHSSTASRYDVELAPAYLLWLLSCQTTSSGAWDVGSQTPLPQPPFYPIAGKNGFFVTSGENLRVLSEMFSSRRSPSSLGETWGSGVGMQGGFSRWSLFYSLGSWNKSAGDLATCAGQQSHPLLSLNSPILTVRIIIHNH